MFCFHKAALLPLSAWAVVLSVVGLPFVHSTAHAQAPLPAKALEPPSAPRSDPADPKAVIPATVYRSSLGRYQAFTEPDVAPWRETNELVRQRGGWRAYAREAREPASPPSPPSPSSASPAASAASQPLSSVSPSISPSVKPAMPGHAGHQRQ